MKVIEPLEGKAERVKLEVAAGCHRVGGEVQKEALRFSFPCMAGFELLLSPLRRLAVSVMGLL